MTQVLCYTGIRFDTCWRPSSIATNIVITQHELCGLFTPIRFVR